MLVLATEIGCTWDQLSILQNRCFVQDHRVQCPNCSQGKDILNGLEMTQDFRMHHKGMGGWICRDCGTDLKEEIREHIATCPNFSK